MRRGPFTDAPSADEGAFKRLQESIKPEWIEQALEATGTATLRKRRLPAEQVLWLVLGMALYRGRPIDELVGRLDLVLPGTGRVSMERSAVSQARGRLGDEPMKWLFERCAHKWAHESARKRAWRGLALYGVDGTTVRVPDSPANRAHFGSQDAGAGRGTSGYPLARVVTLMALRGEPVPSSLALDSGPRTRWTRLQSPRRSSSAAQSLQQGIPRTWGAFRQVFATCECLRFEILRAFGEAASKGHGRARAAERDTNGTNTGGRVRPGGACYGPFRARAPLRSYRDEDAARLHLRGTPSRRRSVLPCFTRAGDEVLRAVQRRGSSRSGHFAGGKLWTVSKMRLVRTLEERFVADDPDYEPNDSAMARAHCRILAMDL